MEKQPQFPFAPKDFARCLNATCPRSQNCLRRTAALQDINPEKPDVPLNKNDAFQKVQKRRVQEKR